MFSNTYVTNQQLNILSKLVLQSFYTSHKNILSYPVTLACTRPEKNGARWCNILALLAPRIDTKQFQAPRGDAMRNAASLRHNKTTKIWRMATLRVALV